jgi:hypothetical protein
VGRQDRGIAMWTTASPTAASDEATMTGSRPISWTRACTTIAQYLTEVRG